MQDIETETLWSHITGEALDGPLKGRFLEVIPSVQADWANWVGQHPETILLEKEEEVRGSRYERYFRDTERMGMFRVEWLQERLPGKNIVYGMTMGPFSLAITRERLASDPLLNARLGYDPVAICLTDEGGVRAFIARADSIDLSFVQTGDVPEIRDRETGSVWNLVEGVSTSGPYEGTELEEIKVLPIFWFAWSNFYPRTEIID